MPTIPSPWVRHPSWHRVRRDVSSWSGAIVRGNGAKHVLVEAHGRRMPDLSDADEGGPTVSDRLFRAYWLGTLIVRSPCMPSEPVRTSLHRGSQIGRALAWLWSSEDARALTRRTRYLMAPRRQVRFEKYYRISKIAEKDVHVPSRATTRLAFVLLFELRAAGCYGPVDSEAIVESSSLRRSSTSRPVQGGSKSVHGGSMD